MPRIIGVSSEMGTANWGSAIYRSDDGKIWKSNFTPSSTQFEFCTIVGTSYAIFAGQHNSGNEGVNPKIFKSINSGVTFTEVYTAGPTTSYRIHSSLYNKEEDIIVFGGGRDSLSVRNHMVIYSTDGGDTWNERIKDAANDGPLVRLAYGNGVYIATSHSILASPPTKAYKIPDLSDTGTWTAGLTPMPISFRGVVWNYDAEEFLIWGGNTSTFELSSSISTDNGSTWSNYNVGISANNVFAIGTDVAYGNGIYMAVGNDNAGNSYVYTSSNGTSFTKKGPFFPNAYFSTITYAGGGRWIAGGGGSVTHPNFGPFNGNSISRIFVSDDDGDSWTQVYVEGISGAESGILWMALVPTSISKDTSYIVDAPDQYEFNHDSAWISDVPTSIEQSLDSAWQTYAPDKPEISLDSAWTGEFPISTLQNLDAAYLGYFPTKDTVSYDIAWFMDRPLQETTILNTANQVDHPTIFPKADFEFLQIFEQWSQTVFTQYTSFGSIHKFINLNEVNVGGQTDLTQDLELTTKVSSNVVMAQNNEIAGSIIMVQAIAVDVGGQVEFTNLEETPLGAQTIFAQNLQVNADVYGQTKFVQAMYDSAPVIVSTTTQDQITITSGSVSQPIDIIEANVSITEGDFGYVGTFIIDKYPEYWNVSQDDPFTFDFYGETYNFIVDSKTLSRDAPENLVLTIIGVSPIMKYSSPRTAKLTKTWDTASTAKTIAEDALGESIQWDALDFPVEANAVSVTNADPIDVVKLLADVIKAVITSDPDGTIRVQPKHAYDIPDYPSITGLQVFDEDNHIMGVNEDFISNSVFNNFCVGNTEEDTSDSMEFIEDDNNPLAGTIRAYAVPWRAAEYVEISTTADDGRISLIRSSPVVKYRDVPEPDKDTGELIGELVEIFDGEGSISYPIYNLVSLEWLSADIGFNFVRGRKEITSTDPNNKYGLVRVVYNVRYYEYTVSSLEFKPAQFLMKDLRDG